jgi:hypothetical protein
MPLYCRNCWERDGVLAAKVKQQDVDDPKWGHLKGCPVCSRCDANGILTRATCKTFYRERTLRHIDLGS